MPPAPSPTPSSRKLWMQRSLLYPAAVLIFGGGLWLQSKLSSTITDTAGGPESGLESGSDSLPVIQPRPHVPGTVPQSARDSDTVPTAVGKSSPPASTDPVPPLAPTTIEPATPRTP